VVVPSLQVSANGGGDLVFEGWVAHEVRARVTPGEYEG
jgi:hypothetical protein